MICRYDEEDNSNIDFSFFEEKVKLLEKLEIDMVVISDYAKGVINNTGLCEYVIKYANSKKLKNMGFGKIKIKDLIN